MNKTNKGLEFNPETHRYYLDGKPMTGVTTVLGVIAKPALIQWAANQAVDYIEKALIEIIKSPSLLEGMDETKFLESFQEARTAHAKKRDDAASKGTDVHGVIEEIIKWCIENNQGYLEGVEKTRKQEKDFDKQVQHFIDWSQKNNVKFLESEKVMYHPDWFVGGTADFTCEIDGKKYVGDIKTGKGVYYEAFIQMGAYRTMLENMGEKDFSGSLVVHLPQGGKLNTYYHYDYETDRKSFESALYLYRAKQLYDKPKSN